MVCVFIIFFYFFRSWHLSFRSFFLSAAVEIGLEMDLGFRVTGRNLNWQNRGVTSVARTEEDLLYECLQVFFMINSIHYQSPIGQD